MPEAALTGLRHHPKNSGALFKERRLDGPDAFPGKSGFSM
jgi:hypothetical protein